MLPLSPALFIAAASALLPRDETVAIPTVLPRQDDLAEYDPVQRDNHGPDDGMTTAAFIAHVGYWSHRAAMGRSVWPFQLSATCDELAHVAADRAVLSIGQPDAGAILLRWSMLTQRFTRASIVISSNDVLPMVGGGWSYDCLVIEGSARVWSSGAEYSARLDWVRRVRRRCCPMLGDRFVSWVDLDARGETVRAAPRRVA